MTARPAERRLAAIMVADVTGYSRMMGLDEERTLERVKALRREIVEPCAARARGRLVKTTGDGFLLEFGSVHDAFRCGRSIQARLRAGDGVGDGEAGPLQLRIGINVGDIIFDGEDVFGDGVNVAARLEPLA
ncbi:MAG TPA: adenylate/guanylate cyclase domain-containing protein, partial [Allosphingosinicella sp.]